jgi:hypothetical protein
MEIIQRKGGRHRAALSTAVPHRRVDAVNILRVTAAALRMRLGTNPAGA